MDELVLRQLLDDVRSGACSPDDAVFRLRRLPFADLGFAKVDHHRELRIGTPRGRLRPGQDARAGARRSWASCSTAPEAAARAPDSGGPVILTRADAAQVDAAMAGIRAASARSPVGRPVATRSAASCRPSSGARAPRASGPHAGDHRGHLRPARRPRVRGDARGPRDRADRAGRLRRRRRAPAAGLGRRARRRRRRRRRGGHGGRAGQPGRRDHARRRSSPSRPAPATAPPSKG